MILTVSVAVLLAVFACGGGGEASSAHEAAQRAAKAIATGDFQRMLELCNPSTRESMSEEERERYVAGGWLDGPRAEMEAVFAWIRAQAKSAEAVRLLRKKDTTISGISISDYTNWARVHIYHWAFVDGDPVYSLRLPGNIDFELIMEDGSWWTNCGESSLR